MNIVKIKHGVIDLGYRTKIIDITDEAILLANGGMITYDHSQDCCEHNYADFTSLLDTSLIEESFFKLDFEEVDEYGFKFNGHMVNCYSSQNGYYTNELNIYYSDGEERYLVLELEAQVIDD